MDELLFDAIEAILENEMASKAMLQRKLMIGYDRAEKLVDAIESMGIIGPEVKDQPRQINMTLSEWLSVIENRSLKSRKVALEHNKSDGHVIVDHDAMQVPTPLTEVWNHACRYIENELQPMGYNTWIKTIRAVDDGGRLLLVVPNDFNKEIVENRYLSLITSALKNAAGGPLAVEVVTRK